MGTRDSLLDISLVEHIARRLGENGVIKGNKTFFHSTPEDNTPSLCVFEGGKGWFDYSKGIGGTIIDFEMHRGGKECDFAIKSLCEEYGIPLDTTEKPAKQPKRETLYSNFEAYRLSGVTPILARFLCARGFSRELMDEYHKNIHEVSKELGEFRSLYMGTGQENKDVLIFPCMDDTTSIVGAKLRRSDNEKILNVKSMTITGGKTGLLYTTPSMDFSLDRVIITEGEVDYITLRILGFRNVIGNLGGVGANMDKIAQLTKNITEVVSFYDSDEAGQKANIALSKKLGRPIRSVRFPKIDGKDKLDVNDLFKMGYRKEDFEKLLNDTDLIGGNVPVDTSEEEISESSPIIEVADGYNVVRATKDGPNEVRLTNFKMKLVDILLQKTHGDDTKSVIFEINGVRGTFSGTDLSDVKKFSVKIKSMSPFFSKYGMTPNDLEALTRFVVDKNKDIKITHTLSSGGYVPSLKLWVFSNGVVLNKKFYKYDDNSIADLGEYKVKYPKNLNKNIPKYQDDTCYEPGIMNVVEDHLGYMFCGDAQGRMVLGFIIASLFTHRYKEGDPFPYLFVTGRPKSGKTTALEFAMKIIGNSSAHDNFESVGKFIDEKDMECIHSLPIWKDEYKNSKKVRAKDGILKTMYNRIGTTKGTKDLGLITFSVNASLILSGQESPDDEAVFSRCCMIHVQEERPKGNFSYKEIQKDERCIGSIFRWYLENRDVDEDYPLFRSIMDTVEKKLSETYGIGGRPLEVYSTVISGFFFWRYYFTGNTSSTDERNGYIEEFMECIHRKQTDEREQDVVNDFFETIYVEMDNGRNITFSQEYIHEKNIRGLDKILIHHGALHRYYEEIKKRVDGECIKKSSMKTYIKSALKAEKDDYSDGKVRWIIIPKENATEEINRILARKKESHTF